MQKQPYRWTNCRCIFEDYWDLIGGIVIMILAMAGFFWLLEEIKNKYKKK